MADATREPLEYSFYSSRLPPRELRRSFFVYMGYAMRWSTDGPGLLVVFMGIGGFGILAMRDVDPVGSTKEEIVRAIGAGGRVLR